MSESIDRAVETIALPDDSRRGEGVGKQSVGTVGIVGTGAVGASLTLALAERDFPVVAVCSRTGVSAARLAARLPTAQVMARAQEVADAADLVFITTPDAIIATVAGAVRWRPGQAVVHCSGGLSCEALAPAAASGALVGGLHPIQSFAARDGSPRSLEGIWYGVEAEPPLRDRLMAIVRCLGGQSIVVRSADKPLYHAASVFASNYLVAVIQAATEVWRLLGADPSLALPDAGREQAPGAPPRVGEGLGERSVEALLPLMRGTLANVGRLGLPHALTGPIARGDVGTVRRHLAALDQRAPEVAALYRALGRATVPIGRAKGTLGPEAAAELLKLLKGE
ncbi:MAG: DUF2520 domain-containing protein [Chloroflexi bacterium]|nr:DUF2520 domain-containing protein [Chloroflexota bacterium]